MFPKTVELQHFCCNFTHKKLPTFLPYKSYGQIYGRTFFSSLENSSMWESSECALFILLQLIVEIIIMLLIILLTKAAFAVEPFVEQCDIADFSIWPNT